MRSVRGQVRSFLESFPRGLSLDQWNDRAGMFPWALFVFALTIRLLYVTAVAPGLFAADSVEYDALGLRLAEGRGYVDAQGHPTAYRPPGYPMFLAAVYYLAGYNLTAVRIAQAVLGAGICLLVYVIAQHCFNGGVAVASSVLCALYPPLVVNTSEIMAEVLFTFLLLFGVTLLLVARGSFSLVASGCLFGLALLTKPLLLFFFPFLALWVVFGRRGAAARSLTLIGSGLLLVLLPWILRNYAQFHAFVPLSNIGGLALYNSYVVAEKGLGFNSLSQVGEAFWRLGEVERNHYLIQKTFEYMVAHPMMVLQLALSKLLLFFYPFDGYWYPVSFGSKYNIFWGLTLSFSLVGMAVQRARPGDPVTLLYCLLASFLCYAGVFYGSPRFRMPLEPLLVCFAVQGAVYLNVNHRVAAGVIVFLNVGMFAVFRFFGLQSLFEWLKVWI